MTSRFADALVENPAPRQLGDVRLVYEPGRLMGMSRHPSVLLGVMPSVLVGVSVAAAIGFALTAGPVATGLASVGFLAGAGSLVVERVLGRRRFVLHFANESLRMEAAGYRAPVLIVPFDDVKDVLAVERRPGRFSLHVVFSAGEDAALQEMLLVDFVSPSQSEPLLRVWRMLRNAFGLRDAPEEDLHSA